MKCLLIWTMVPSIVLGSIVGSANRAAAQDTKTPQNSKEAHKQQQADSKQQHDSAAQAGSKSSPSSADQPDKVVHTQQEWQKLLTREQFRVLRMKGTERPFRNKYDKNFKPGKYVCAACGQVLFSSDTKFDSGCGWPAFFSTLAGDRVVLTPDYSLGMIRTEVTCARCGSHLGHVFRDAPQTPTGLRYCINSVSLKFIPADSKDDEDSKADRKASGKPAEGEPAAHQDKQRNGADHKSPSKSDKP